MVQRGPAARPARAGGRAGRPRRDGRVSAPLGWAAGLACGAVTCRRPWASPSAAPRSGPARPGRPRHAGAGGARRRGAGPGRSRAAPGPGGLVGAGLGGAGARPGRRRGGPAHRHGLRLRRRVRHGGRRVPDPRAQRVRRRAARAVGAADRRWPATLWVAARLLPWLRGAGAAAAVGQGRRRGPGHRADRRRGRRPARTLDGRARWSRRWSCSRSRSATRCCGCGAHRHRPGPGPGRCAP